jgi:hypothetical protein
MQEAETTIKARDILVKALKSECFHVEEEKVFYCDNNMGEKQTLPYRADIYARIEFIIELDPPSSHKGNRHSIKDKWRNENIYNRHRVPTVRLQPSDILKDPNLEMTFKEVLSQLKKYE